MNRAHLEALLRLAQHALDWDAAMACRILLGSSTGAVRVAAARRVELFRERMRRVT